MSILQKYIVEFRAGRDLVGDDAEVFLDTLIGETDEPLLAEVFRAWDRKGIASDEIYQTASLMRRRCTPVTTEHETFVDIVGTGGARNKTFNVSTASAFVVAGVGVPVAKHGNRAATSNSGSADVLTELGIEPAVDAATAERCLNEIGICFMFAPNYHRLSATLARVRRGLGFPTIFNCVGPLCNPANVPHQVIGVWDEKFVAKMADALSRLGTRKSWIVHGRDGTDEVSSTGSTVVAEVTGTSIREFEISSDDFGFSDPLQSGVKACSPEQSADLIRSVLHGDNFNSAAEKLVLSNAAAALYVSDKASSLRQAFEIATESIRSGSAKDKMVRLAEMTKR